MSWKCEVLDIISEMQDEQGNTITDINALLYDSLAGGSTYRRTSVEVAIATFYGTTQKDISRQIDELQRDILPLSMFIGSADYRWTKI